MIRALSIFVALTILLLTIFTSATKPVMHKQFILENQNFKMKNLSQRPDDLQSVQLFHIGDSRAKTPKTDTPIKVVQTEAPIIPSNINEFVPNNFIQKMPTDNQAQNNIPNTIDNSDATLQEVQKMLTPETSPTPKQENANQDKKPSACPICDGLKDAKVRAELIAWNKWRSDIQNQIMENAYVEAPYGTLFFFSFNVDKNKRITNIKVITSNPNAKNDIPHIKSTIISLDGKSLLEFPKGTNRKSVLFTGGFLMSDTEELSSPSDYRDFEYIQTSY